MFKMTDETYAAEILHEVETLANLGTFVFFPKKNFVEWSPQLFKIMGYDPEKDEASVENYYARIHPDDLEVHLQNYNKFIDKSEVASDQRLRLLMPDGEVRHIRVRSLEKKDENGELDKVIGTIIDETQEQIFQEEKIQREKLESIHILTHGVAHDFNNFLQTIMASNETIQSKLKSPSPDFEAIISQLKVIDRASHYSADLVNKMISLAQNGSKDLNTINLKDTLTDMAPLIRSILGGSVDLHIQNNWDGNIHFNKVDFAQVLINLAKNAKEAMTGKGKLTLANLDFSDEPGHLGIDFSEYTGFSIQDNGMGISEENLKNIFTPFFTTKREQKGQGLGLSSVYTLIENNGGKITVNSEEGLGTIFYIYFKKSKEDVSKSSNTTHSDRATGLNILYAEDNSDLREVMADLLNEEFNTSACCDGKEALETFNLNYDLVISDLSMPHLNGKELAEAIWKKKPSQKFIFLTGFNQAAEMGEEHADKDFLFLKKPIGFEDLKIAIGKICRIQTTKVA